jgi:hypothetical protein
MSCGIDAKAQRMIVSIHVPKTAGKSFRLRLEALLGSRMMSDYADWIGLDTSEARAQRAEQAARMHAQRDEILHKYDLIYGQFIADKYVGQFPIVAFTAFLRDPCQQAVSHYQFLSRHNEIDHPWVKRFREERPTLPEFIEALPNFQSVYLGRVPLDEFAMIGLFEQYDRSVALFEAVFGLKLPPETERTNVNPGRLERCYEIDPMVRRAIDIYRAGDVDLYRRACERFDHQCRRYGV